MFRQLLTLLALFTGLAAVAQPVQAARLGTVVVAVGETEQAPPFSQSAITLQLGGSHKPRLPQAPNRAPEPRPAVVPAVQLQADRAHE